MERERSWKKTKKGNENENERIMNENVRSGRRKSLEYDNERTHLS